MIKYLSIIIILTSSCLFSIQQREVISKIIKPEALKDLIAEHKDLQLVDVRTLREFNAGHIPDAVIIDYYQPDFQDKLKKLDKSRPIAVYCAVGIRSNNTLRILKKMGFKEAYDLAGGIRSWTKKGLPIEK